MILRTLSLAAISLTLAACNITGSAQKGPFSLGSDISAVSLDDNTTPIAATTINTDVFNNRGNFSVNFVDWSGWTEMVATGQYFNEFTNITSSDSLTLNAIMDKNRLFDTANIHLFTHLAAARMRQRVINGQDNTNAWRDTQTEMRNVFGLFEVSQNIDRGVEQLSLINGVDRYRRDNANLLLFTGSFLAVGGNATRLQALTDDFADDAQFNGVGEAVFNSIAIAGNGEGLLQTLSQNLSANGISTPPDDEDLQELPIWVNTGDVSDVDEITPLITLLGESLVEIEVGTVYTDAGASANDNVDGDITNSIVTVGDQIETSVEGNYIVTYNVTDAAGNTATEVTREVNVVQAADTTNPVVTLNGAASIDVVTGGTYAEQGATALDDRDGELAVIIGGDTVDTNSAVGTSFTVTYTATDAAGNSATIQRTVTIIQGADTTNPVLTLNGAASIDVEAGGTYAEQGATALDDRDGELAVIIGGDTVETNSAVGTSFTVTYTATDAAGNSATIQRTVTIIQGADTTNPVLTLNGAASIDVVTGGTYTEQGATALDDRDGELAVIIGGDTVDTNAVAGTSFTVTYTATDVAVNSSSVTRTVNIIPAPYRIVFNIISSGEPVVSDNLVYVINRNSDSDSVKAFISDSDAIVTANGETVTGDPILDLPEVNYREPGTFTVNLSFVDEFNRLVTNVVTVIIRNLAPDALDRDVTIDGETVNNNIFLFGSDEDDDALVYEIISGPVNGTLLPLNANDESVSYTPNAGFAGTDSFTYSASDGLETATAEVKITVTDKSAPIITIGSAQVSIVEGTTFTDDVSANDNVDNDITAQIVTTGNVDTELVGEYTLTYNVSDAAGNLAIPVTRTVTVTEAPIVSANTCTATVQSELGFTDNFVEFNQDDIPWPQNQRFNALTVTDIADVFNRARRFDTTARGKALKMPSQTVWDNYSHAEKALYLINSERCVRGIRPYEGIDTALNQSVSQAYADLLEMLSNGISHTADGTDPKTRLATAGVIERGIDGIGVNADFFTYSENLAFSSISSSDPSTSIIHEPIAKAVYAWIYDDKEATLILEDGVDPTPTYGHRKFVLATGLIENSGAENQEGLISVGVASSNIFIGGEIPRFNAQVYIVQNGFDPNENWDMINVQSVNLIEPEQCLDTYFPIIVESGFSCIQELQ